LEEAEAPTGKRYGCALATPVSSAASKRLFSSSPPAPPSLRSAPPTFPFGEFEEVFFEENFLEKDDDEEEEEEDEEDEEEAFDESAVVALWLLALVWRSKSPR
jgi:hypothetical protein